MFRGKIVKFARVNKWLSPVALWFVFLCAGKLSINSKAVDLCDCSFRFDVSGLVAFCLFETCDNLAFLYKNRAASPPKIVSTSASCQFSEFSPASLPKFCLTSASLPILVPLFGWRLKYLFGKFAKSCYSGCIRQSCYNLNLVCGVTALPIRLRCDSSKVLLFTARFAKNSYSAPILMPKLNFYRKF